MGNYQKSYFLRLQDYIADGSTDALNEEEQAYEDLLFSTAGIIRREGRPAAMAWLIADRECTRHVAERVCAEAVNLFYATDHVRQEAWRNLLFEKLLAVMRDWEHTNIRFDEETGERICNARAKDYEAYVKIVKQAAALKHLSERDEQPPVNSHQLQINIYGTNAQDIGLPATDRRAILQADYFRQLPAKHQQRLEMELGLKPLNVEEMLDNSINLANEVTGKQ
jgi:hypothetical protein